MNGLELFRKLSRETLHQQTISSLQEWRDLMKMLCENKVILPSDMKSIDENFLVFPMKLQNVESIIMQAKADPKLAALLFDSQTLQEDLSNVKTTLSVWRQTGLTKEQTLELLNIFQKLKQQVQTVKTRVESVHKDISETNEQHLQVIDNLVQLQKMEKGAEVNLTAHEYQQSQLFAIEKHWGEIRVREVHYRNQPIKVLDSIQGITRQIGFNIKNDQPVEVTKIPKTFQNLYQLETILNTFNANRELLFSPYFQNYLGSNFQADANYDLHFSQLLTTKSLTQIITQAKYKLGQQSALYQFWIRQIFYGLKDLLFMTIYLPIMPIGLEAIHVGDRGLSVFFKGVNFLRVRVGPSESHEILQSKLLKNYGLLCLELLGLTEQTVDEIRGIEFRCFIKTLLNCEKQLSRVQRGVSNKFLTFGLCESAPVLTKKNIPEIEPCIIYQSFASFIGQ